MAIPLRAIRMTRLLRFRLVKETEDTKGDELIYYNQLAVRVNSECITTHYSSAYACTDKILLHSTVASRLLVLYTYS